MVCIEFVFFDKFVVQYVFIIDVGFMGFRIYVYKFNNCGLFFQLEYEMFKVVKLGFLVYVCDLIVVVVFFDFLFEEVYRVVFESL